MTDTVKRANELAEKNGVSLFSLCKANNIPYSTINKTKHRGGNLSVDTIELLCQAFGISLSEFFAEEKNSPTCEGQIKIDFYD